jgi:anaerobic glycerol-3-phosphate dehydrogenase
MIVRCSRGQSPAMLHSFKILVELPTAPPSLLSWTTTRRIEDAYQLTIAAIDEGDQVEQ